ncbi:dockerin type I domain-containing protein [Halococcoides cellulosivorans]|uniref:EF-hand domain-containing protein n=1 Tax=Halococcoides cellulosivorans TaxID=1679096 RepID=A0A2R4WYV1_9EURY|nr:dockerin type I domain-containing protein [Halococcoides cellulosivorans]AWB26706.1 hypothetical protein HARCEL1_02745 [Halococcoides cellulosivorans]
MTRRTHSDGRAASNDGDRSPRSAVDRRAILKSVGALAASGGLGIGTLGAASATPVESLDFLQTRGNQIVDESGYPVQLHGATTVDPLVTRRSFRHRSIEDILALATSDEWPHSVVRVPCTPQAIGAATARGDTRDDETYMPHDVYWGPIRPGAFDEADLTTYLEKHVDPIVEVARERGAYLMLDYHREYPAFFQRRYERKRHKGLEYWTTPQFEYDAPCGNETFPNDLGMCGERGVLWHGPDQIADVETVPHNQARLNDPDSPDPWFDPWCGAQGGKDLLGEELLLFWKTVADRYGGDADQHVLFDLFSSPTGPYYGDWGAPLRTPREGRPDDNRAGRAMGPEPIDDAENGRPYWGLFLERAKPWLNVVAEHAPHRLVTVGSPRWSQWTYWASELTVNGANGTASLTGVDSGATNVAYAAQIHTQSSLRPLSKYFGTPARRVPVVVTAFGWESGGSNLWFQYLAGTTGVWGEGDPTAIEQWGDPAGRPLSHELSADEQDQLNRFGMDGDTNPSSEAFVGFRTFFENYPVHPIVERFDWDYSPQLFEDPPDSEWQLRARADAPGLWWQEYLDDHAANAPPGEDPCKREIPGLIDRVFPDCTTTGTPTLPDQMTDPDGDGLYEDLSGNGKIDFPDVNYLFQNAQSDTIQENVQYFDFTGDGRVDPQDVLALFEQV